MSGNTRWRAGSLATLLLSVAAAGCDLTGNKDPRITLTLASPSATVGQGGETTVGITITRENFSNAVSLSVQGQPAGVTATFTPASISAQGTTSTLTVEADGDAAPGTTTLTIRASGEGVTEQTVTLDLTVNVTGSFTLAPLDDDLRMAQGGGGTATILVQRTGGNAATVSLSVSGAPDGVTASFQPSSTTERTASLLVTVGNSVTVGPHSLTITGTAAGLANQTATLTVQVIAPPGLASLSIPFCVNNPPIWFAYQNEGYAWQRVTANGSTMTFDATQKVGVAYAFAQGSGVRTFVYYGTRAEMGSDTDQGCGGNATVSGTVTGVATGQTVSVSIGSADTTFTEPQSSYSMSNVRTSTVDVIAVAGAGTGGDQPQFTGDKMIIRRSFTPTSGGTVSPLDFTGEEFDLGISTFEIVGNSGDDQTYLENYLWTPTYTFARLQEAAFPTPLGSVLSVPSGERDPGDLHELYVDAYTATSSAIIGHSTLQYLNAIPGSHSTTLGPQLSSPTVTLVTTSPYFRGKGVLPFQAQYDAVARLIFLRGERLLIMGMTTGYLGTTPSAWEIITPDFTGVAGFDDDWMPTFGGGADGTIYQMDAFSGDSDFLFGARPSNGDIIEIAYKVAFMQATLGMRALKVPAPHSPSRRALQYFRR